MKKKTNFSKIYFSQFYRYELERTLDVTVFLPDEHVLADPQVGHKLPSSGLLVNFRVQIEVAPNGALFEAVITQDYALAGAGAYHLTGDINRNNEYGEQSWCVSDRDQRKLCFCKQQKQQETTITKKSKIIDY